MSFPNIEILLEDFDDIAEAHAEYLELVKELREEDLQLSLYPGGFTLLFRSLVFDLSDCTCNDDVLIV